MVTSYKCEIHFSTKEIIEEDDKRVAFSGVDEENVWTAEVILKTFTRTRAGSQSDSSHYKPVS